MEKRTLTFTYYWMRDHLDDIELATVLVNYCRVNNCNPLALSVEKHLISNLNYITIEDSEDENFTKIIFDTENQLTEFLLKYG